MSQCNEAADYIERGVSLEIYRHEFYASSVLSGSCYLG